LLGSDITPLDFILIMVYISSMKWVTVTINNNPVKVAFDETSIHIYNAFPIKDNLKLRGYRWNPDNKSWFITPTNVTDEMELLKNNLKTISTPSPERGSKDQADLLPESFSIVELRNRVEEIIQSTIGRQIWVRGVIASDIKNYQWASYFDLKDEDEKSNLFFHVEVKKKNYKEIKKKLKDVADDLQKDLPVFCLVELSVSVRYAADLRLHLLDVLPEFTRAKIRSQMDLTLETLSQEGILEYQKRLKLPDLLFNIGLITSAQGTSVKDVLAGLTPFQNKYQFYFVDTRMEGASAADSVIASVKFLQDKARKLKLDAIIITRGGGSEQSLAVFNDHRLCQAVCKSTIPILTAIGHEKDISAIEICSHFTPTPSTPSGIGKFLSNRFSQIQQDLSRSIEQLMHYFMARSGSEMAKLRQVIRNLSPWIDRVIQMNQERFGYKVSKLVQSLDFVIKSQNKRLREGVSHILSRGKGIFNREGYQLTRMLRRIDFKKRYRENRKCVEEVSNLGNQILDLTNRTLVTEEMQLKGLSDVVMACDPNKILKKGFTLTLNEKDQVVKSLKEFKQGHQRRLKFYDGITHIVEKEEV